MRDQARIDRAAELLDGLNDEQVAAVQHSGSPLLVVAGPGSGKTRILVRRIAYSVLSGRLDPRDVMAITFTQRAAAEMRSRLTAADRSLESVRMGTFHWMCHGLLRRYATTIGLPRHFVLLDPRDARGALASVVQGLERTQLGVYAAAISAVKNGASEESEGERRKISPKTLAAYRAAYDKALRGKRALDLDDLLCETVHLLENDSDTRDRCRRSLGELLVDEYQDTNPVQERLLVLLAPRNGGIVAVGDEDQAIYGWRQACSGTIAQFVQDFPGADVITLGRGYRNSKHVLRAANALIARNPDRAKKTMHTDNPAGPVPVCFVAHDERDEAEWIARELRHLHEAEEIDWAEMAVLYRVNAQSRAIEERLVQGRIPYRVLGGRRFYDRPEIREVVAYLRLALDASDDGAAEYLLLTVPGIGERRIEALREASAAAGDSLSATFLGDGTLTYELPRGVQRRARELGRNVQRVVSLRERSVREVVDAAIAAVASGLDSSIDPADPSGPGEELEELRAAIAEITVPRGTLRDLVDRMSLEPTDTVERDGVSLLSLHAAKGLEFRVVFIEGMEDGLLPHRRSLDLDRDIQEERRLAYVGVTRAAERLYLTYAHLRFLSGQAHAHAPSRFLGEIGQQNLATQFSPATALRPRLHTANLGDRVLHPRWKAGTVTGVEGTGRETLVTIQFDVGTKQRLQLCHAPLIQLVEETRRVRTG